MNDVPVAGCVAHGEFELLQRVKFFSDFFGFSIRLNSFCLRNNVLCLGDYFRFSDRFRDNCFLGDRERIDIGIRTRLVLLRCKFI